jgi:hypothetical protein
LLDHGFVIWLPDGGYFFELMNAVPSHIKAVFAQVVVLALQAVKPFPFNRFLLRRALITKILLN